MKNKAILLIMALCLMIVGCACFAACNPDTPEPDKDEVGFKVELSYDNTQGTVTVSDPSEGKLYDAGEKVTITVTPKVGFAVESFKVGDSIVALSDGKYSFDISGDTTISVTFKGVYYRITTTISPVGRGTIELEPQKDEYMAGETVSGTVKPAANYKSEGVFVNGEEVSDKFTFEIKADTEIKAYFVSTYANVLDSLKGSIVFEGTRKATDNNSKNEVTVSVKTTFDSQKRAVSFEAFDGVRPLSMWAFKENASGKCVQYAHDITGEVMTQAYDEDFDTIFNPFDLLKSGDLRATAEHTYTIDDAAKRSSIVEALFGDSFSVKTITLTEEVGAISHITIESDNITNSESGDNYKYLFELDVKAQGEATIEDEYFEDYKLPEGSDTLIKALETAAAAKSYTVTYTSGNTNYPVYYTSEGIYVDEKGKERGYIARPDGNVWSFDYDTSSKAVKFDEIVYEDHGIDGLKALFTFADENGEYYNLLKKVGDGKYAIRPADVYYSQGQAAAFLGVQMATGYEQLAMFSQAIAVELTLDGGALDHVDLTCVDANDGALSNVTITFGNWDKTDFPIDLEGTDLTGTIDAAYTGIWYDNKAELILEVNVDSINFNGYDATNITEETSGGYGFTVEGQKFVLKLDDGTMKLNFGGNSVTLYNNCEWAGFLATYTGAYRTEEKMSVAVNIMVTGITVRLGGKLIKATDIEFEELTETNDDGTEGTYYQFSFKLDTEDYIFQLDPSQMVGNTLLGVFAKADESRALTLVSDTRPKSYDYSEFAGTYQSGQYKLVITADKITIAKDGEEAVEVTEAGLYYATDSYGSYYTFEFLYDDKFCSLETLDNGVLLILDAKGENEELYYLQDAEYDITFEDYVGEFTGTDGTTTYSVKVTDDGIEFTIGDGESTKVTIDYFSAVSNGNNSYGYYVFKVDGKLYRLYIYPQLKKAAMYLESGTTVYFNLVTEQAGE